MKYIVTDSRKDGTGDIYTTECATLEEAIVEAERQYKYLSPSEKAVRTVAVIESANPDEDAEDHLDGDLIWKR